MMPRSFSQVCSSFEEEEEEGKGKKIAENGRNFACMQTKEINQPKMMFV